MKLVGEWAVLIFAIVTPFILVWLFGGLAPVATDGVGFWPLYKVDHRLGGVIAGALAVGFLVLAFKVRLVRLSAALGAAAHIAVAGYLFWASVTVG